jgi:hypothetical protein
MTLVAAATDSSALGVLDAVREAGQEENFAIVGQDCIPEVMEEMRRGTSAIIGSISHEPETYGPRLIQLGIAILRGYTVPPYNYVHHKAVTPETLGDEAKAHKREARRGGAGGAGSREAAGREMGVWGGVGACFPESQKRGTGGTRPLRVSSKRVRSSYPPRASVAGRPLPAASRALFDHARLHLP